jgi:hypothetical protein
MFMPNKHPLMKLCPEEELFLRHWMFEQFNYQSGPGPAKRLQIEHQAVPAELSILIAAAIPDPSVQKAAGLGPPPPADGLKWPWTEEDYHERLAEARAALGRSNQDNRSRMASARG